MGRIALTNGTYDAALWQNGTVTDLNKLYAGILPAGFTLNNATAIDDQGDIAGYGTDAADHTNQAFVIYAPTPGDANLDGRVDVNDLTIVLSHFGQTGATWAQGEFTGDGKVDVNDLTIVLSHFGQTVGASAGAGRRTGTVCAGPARRRPAGLRRVGQGRANFWWGCANRSTVIPHFVAQQAKLPRPKPHQSFGLLDPPYQGYTVQRAGVLGGILLSVDALWVDPRREKGLGMGDFED